MNRIFLAFALTVLPVFASAQTADVQRAQPDTPSFARAADGQRTQLEALAGQAMLRMGVDADAQDLTVHQLGSIHMIASGSDGQSGKAQQIRRIVN